MTPRDDGGRGSEPWDGADQPGRYGYDDGYADELDLDEDWTEEDERRYQERRRQELKRVRRRRRQAASFALVVLLVMGVGATAVGVYNGWWEWPLIGQEDTAAPGGPGAPETCPTPTATAALPAEVSVRVLNSTDRTGLAGAVAAELQARGFTVTHVGNDSGDVTVAEAAVVRHGPEGLMAARTAAAQIRGATLQDDGRAGAEVEVSLGEGFADMLPPEEAAALLAPPPAPSPTGCVTPTTTTTPPPTTTTAPPTS